MIQIGNGKYIYFDKLNVIEIQKAKGKEVIESLFENDNDILSSKKVYAKMKLSYPELFIELPIVRDSFALFSIIKYLFKDEYYFDRPYISKVEPDKERITTRGLILSHLEKYDVIDFEKYRSYCGKMSTPMIYTYTQLVDKLSSSHVQINNRQMIKKERFCISNENLQDIENILELVLDEFGKFETATFNGYMLLPQIRYMWSKHVLAGIVRSYFNDKYEIIYINNGSRSEPLDYVFERCLL